MEIAALLFAKLHKFSAMNIIFLLNIRDVSSIKALYMKTSSFVICLDCGSGCDQCDSLVFVDSPDDVVGCEKCDKFSLIDDISVCKKCTSDICIRCTWESNYNTYCEECAKICERCSSETHFYRCRYSCIECADVCCEDCLNDDDICTKCIELKKQHNIDIMDSGVEQLDAVVQSSELCEQPTETTDDEVVTQDLSELEISDQLAGAIYAIIILRQRENINDEIATMMVRTLYERDTSTQLLPSQLMALFTHSKIVGYSKTIDTNLKLMNERIAKNNLDKLDEIVHENTVIESDSGPSS